MRSLLLLCVLVGGCSEVTRDEYIAACTASVQHDIDCGLVEHEYETSCEDYWFDFHTKEQSCQEQLIEMMYCVADVSTCEHIGGYGESCEAERIRALIECDEL